jgi:hypothetical protein
MVVHEVHIIRHPVVEPEDYAPIAGNRHAPEAAQVAFQWVKPPAWKDAHMVHPSGLIQRQQNVPETVDVSTRNPSRVVILE